MKNLFVIIDKKKEETSFKSLGDVKRKYGTKKVGHCGTLDPFATGLLIVGVNSYTKLINLIDTNTKTYEGVIELGKATDSMDVDGQVILEKQVPKITDQQIKEIIKNKFTGDIKQTPPMYSAIKINGKKLYEYARAGKEVEVKQRDVTIHRFDFKILSENEIWFDIEVSTGTYIRSIGNDLSIELGTCGFLKELRRTKIGRISVDMVTEPITEISIDQFINEKIYDVTEKQYTDIKNGKLLEFQDISEEVFLAKYNDQIIAIMEKQDNNLFKVKRGI